MPDTASIIARDLVDEVGWLSAIGYVSRRILGAASWRQAAHGCALLAAVVFVKELG